MSRSIVEWEWGPLERAAIGLKLCTQCDLKKGDKQHLSMGMRNIGWLQTLSSIRK
jgi:hypothetical protein